MAGTRKDPMEAVQRYGGYGGAEDGSYTVFDSRSAKYGNASASSSSAQAEKAANVLNQLKKNNEVIKDNMGIWKGVTTAYGFNNFGQHSIEGLKKMVDMPVGSHIIVYDFETVGSSPMDIAKGKAGTNFYTPTELGLRKAVKQSNGTFKFLDDKLSVLVQPHQKVGKQLENLLANVTGNPWVGANPDVARTLSDLVLYSGNKKTHFDENGNLISVKNQNRGALPLKDSVISSADNVGLMKKGLDRLLSGTPAKELAAQLNQFMAGTVNPMFVAFNNYNFDQPLGMDFFGTQVMDSLKNDPVHKQYIQDFMNAFGGHQVDLLHAERTARRNMYQRHGTSNTLERQAEIFGFEQSLAHFALADAGATLEKVNQVVTDPKMLNYLSTGGRPGGNMGYFDNSSISRGDILFSRSGLGSSGASPLDGVFRLDRKGNYKAINDMQANPIYKSTTYQVLNWIDGANIEGKQRWGVELYNMDDQLHHIIYRDSKAELEDIMHGHFNVVDKVRAGHKQDLAATNRDRALRRWNKMWSTESGGGDNLVRRMMGALDIKKNIESQWDAHTNPYKIAQARGISEADAAIIADKNRATVDRLVNRAIKRGNEWNNDTFVRDFRTMLPRLEGEEDWIRGFMNHLDSGPYNGKSDYMRRVRNMAWNEFGNVMTSMFGENKSLQRFGHDVKGINLRISGNDEVLRLTDVDSIRGNMYSMLYRDHSGKPGLSIMKQRYRDLLMELKAKNALAAKQFEFYYKEFDKVKWDPKNQNFPIDNLLNDLANAVVQARENNSIMGMINGIDAEDPTKLRKGRKTKMAGMHTTHAQSVFSDITQRVAPYAKHWQGNKKGTNPLPLHGDKALSILESHTKGIEKMLGRIGVNNLQINTTSLQDPTKGLGNLAKEFMNQNMHVKVVYDGKRDAFSMLLADRSTPASALDGSLKDIMSGRYKHQVAAVHLPKVTKDGQLQLGGQNRVARFIATRENGGFGIQTGYDEILRTLTMNAGYARRILNDAKAMGESNGILQMENILNSRAKGAMQNLSMNNRNMNPKDKERMFEVRSNAANWVRGGAIDLSAVAEDWYTHHYNKTDAQRRKLWGMKSPEEIAELAKGNYELFANTMDINSRRVFQREVDAFWNDRTGMDVGMHSIKDTHASNYLRAGVDIRELYGFGFDNPMARENMQKTVNYLALDKEKVVANLKAAGYSDNDIARMTTMGLTTDRAKEVFEDYQAGSGKMSFMNMRAAYMDDRTLKARVQSAKDSFLAEAVEAERAGDKAKATQLRGYAAMLNNPEAISIYDGNFLMAQEASQGFEATRTKTIKIAANAQLTPEMEQLLRLGVGGGKFDPTKDTTFTSRITMQDALSRQVGASKGKASGRTVTVSQIVNEDLMYDADGQFAKWDNGDYKVNKNRKTDATFEHWDMKNARIASYHVNDDGSRSIVVEQLSKSMQGSKFNTTSGGRLTMNGALPQAVVERIAGMEGVQTIMPSMEPGKKLWGTVLNEYVSLAVDEAVKQTQSGKFTAGNLAKEDALQAIRDLMVTNFNIKDSAVKVLNGGIEVDKRLRVGDDPLTIRNIHGFIQGIEGVLGKEFAGAMNGLAVNGAGAVRYGNLGVGKADVYDWENGIGLVDKSHRGLVTYGWKEADMVSSRANQVLGSGNAVTGWLHGHIESVAAAQTSGVNQIGSGLFRVVTERNSAPTAGDVIIKTTGTSFGVKDPLGASTGRITDKGIHEISMHAVQPLPKVTARHTLPIAEEYAGTILDFGRLKGHFGDEDGLTFGQAISANKGTVLLEMPEVGKGSGFIRDHVRLVDFGDITRDGTATNPVLRDIQKTQQALWRNIKLYQNLGKREDLDEKTRLEKATEIKGNINDLITQYDDQAARMFTNARDGGFNKMFGSADLSNAGRFRIQGVNPMENYTQVNGVWKQTGKYQEGAIYMSRQRLAEMITDDKGRATKTTLNMLESMDIKGVDMTKLDLKKHGQKIVDLVLDNVNEKGLYGLVNRYPTIKESTIQSMRFMIDDDMTRMNDRTAKLTVGTAARLKADYDGDFMSAVLAHYSADNSAEVHEGLKRVNVIERRDARIAGRKAAADIFGDVNNVSKQYNMTVADIVKEFDIASGIAEADRDKKQQAIYNAFTITNRKTKMDALETQEARLGKEMVGFVDNTRYKVDTYMGSVTDMIKYHQAGKLKNAFTAGSITEDEYHAQVKGVVRDARDNRKIVQDMMAAFSQDSISAKKFDYDEAFGRMTKLYDGIHDKNTEEGKRALTRLTNEDITNRYVNLLDMDSLVKNLNTENKAAFLEKNNIVGIWKKDSAEYDNMVKALDVLEQHQKFGAKVGGVSNVSLKIPVSEGLGADVAEQAMNGNTPLYDTEATRRILGLDLSNEARQKITTNLERTKNTILQTYEDLQGSPNQGLVDSLGQRAFNADDHILSGATAADRAGGDFRQLVSKFTPKSFEGGGFAGGAVAFGAMWAASALIRSGPTPEGLQDQTQAPAPTARMPQSAPTARIAENNGEYVNIRINAKNAQNMSEQDIAALVHQEIGGMTTMKMDTTLNVNDNTQNIDQQWLQGVVANAINKNFAF